MTAGLKIGKDGFTLPLVFVTEASAILAVRGAGKTYTAKAIAEETLDAQQQVAVIDPKGDWWGLKSSVDGERAGYPVVIFGGEHADVPLEEEAGELIADVLVDTGMSAILDLSDLSKAGARRFVAAFAEHLYWRKRQRAHQTPLLVIIDEADAFIPQRIPKGGELCYSAIDTQVRRGRGRGLGTLLITQRPAVLAKDVLTQTSALLPMRMGGKHDIDAIDAWIQAHGDVDRAKELKQSLPTLPTGVAWVWAPFLVGDLVKVQIRAARTFDSSATPAIGERRSEPRRMAPIDLDKLGAEIAATVERAKENDPKVLHARIADLEQLLADEQAKPGPESIEIPVPVLTSDALALVERVIDQWDTAYDQAVDVVNTLRDALAQIQTSPRPEERSHPGSASRPAAGTGRAAATAAKPSTAPAPVRSRPPAAATRPAEGVSGPQQRILDSLAWFAGVGIDPVDRTQLALFAGASAKSSAYANNLGALRSAGLIDYPRGGVIALTDAGHQVATPADDISTTEELQAALFSRLSGPQVRILEVLVGKYPSDVDRIDLADAAGASASSSAYANNLGALRTLGLIDYPSRGRVVARDVLFLGGRR